MNLYGGIAGRSRRFPGEYTMDDRNSIADELEQSAKSAARTGKTVAGAAAEAASGNIPGAAIRLLKDENVRKGIAIALAFIVFLTVIVLYIFPMAVYEGIQTVFSRASDEFASALYAGEGGNFFKAVWSFTRTLLSSIWDAARNAVSPYTDSGASLSFYSDTDGNIVTGAEAPAGSVYEKILATEEKYDLRRDAVKDAIKAQASSAVYEKAYAMYCASFDKDRDVFNGFVWDESGCLKSLSDLQAIKLMALYATLTDNDFSATQLADYLKWLGWKSGENAMIIDVFGTAVTVPGWKGTFMPRYLTDEAATNAAEKAGNGLHGPVGFQKFKKEFTDAYRSEYDAYTSVHGASALDFLIKAYVSPSFTPTCQTAMRKLDRYSGTYTVEEYCQDAELQAVVNQYRDEEEGAVYEDFYSKTEYRTVFHLKGETNIWCSDAGKQNYYASVHGGKRMPAFWQSTGTETLPFSEDYVDLRVYQRYKIVTYTAYIQIAPRKTDELVDMCGLVSGRYAADTDTA